MLKNSMWALCTGVFRALWVMESRAKAARVGGEKGLRPGDRQEVVLAHREGSKRTLAAHRLATSACTSGPRTQSQVVLLGLGYRSTTVHTLPKEAQTGLLFIHRLYFTSECLPLTTEMTHSAGTRGEASVYRQGAMGSLRKGWPT